MGYDGGLIRGEAFNWEESQAEHEDRPIRIPVKRAWAMMLDSQTSIKFWREAVNTAVYLHQRTPNEGLRREQRRHLTPYAMLHVHGKPISDNDGNEISYKAPLHLRRFGCYISRRIPEPQRTDSKMGARSKSACTMVGYVHNSTTLWRIWDPEFKTVKGQSEVIFDEEQNAYSSCSQAQEKGQEDMFGFKSKQPTVDHASWSGTGGYTTKMSSLPRMQQRQGRCHSPPGSM